VAEVHALAEELREERLRLLDLLRRRAERLPLDGVRVQVLLVGLDLPRDQALARRRRLAREDERDGLPVVVEPDASREQRVDETRRGRAANLPLGLRPIAVAQVGANLLEHLVELLQRETLPLGGVPGRPRATAERDAIGLDPLRAGPERPETDTPLPHAARLEPTAWVVTQLLRGRRVRVAGGSEDRSR
jgi:hypothetical protein